MTHTCHLAHHPSPRSIVRFVFVFILLTFSTSANAETTRESRLVFGAKTSVLKNGLRLVVVENNRVPVVTHMLWIRAGAADEPESVGGVAHYLEHLMFKGTPQTPPGDYSRHVRAFGGQDNAFTAQDYTAYFATVPREHLETLMKMERDRFLNLAPPADHIASEHKVILEERKQRTENDPLGPLYEQINAYLFASTPYDNPIIGWMADMERLTWADAQAFKATWYAPNNMILILSGDITLAAAEKLATQYYGDWKKRPLPERRRLAPPPHPAPATLPFTSEKIKQPQALRVWRVPSYRQDPKTSLALQVMTEILDGGASTPLYQNMVVRDKIATGISLSYDADSWDGASLWLGATPALETTPERLAERMMTALRRAAQDMTDDDRIRAITKLKRQAVFARDSVTGPAMMIGQAMATGSTLDQIETWPDQIENITLADIRTALDSYVFCAPETMPSCGAPITALVHARAGVPPIIGGVPSLPQTGGHP